MRISAKTAGWALFTVLAVYYYLNRYPGLAFIDSGELALSSFTLGVPHPTGYPLYVILTRPVTLFFNRPIIAVTFFSAIITALTGMIFFRLMVFVRQKLFPDIDKSGHFSFIATLVVFLSPVIAAQGVTNEVYGLALFLNLAAIYAIVKVMLADTDKEQARYYILAWYLTGAALCNHLSSVQLLPGLILATIFFIRRGKWTQAWPALAAILLPLSLYMFLPIRAGVIPPPPANWGDVVTWDNFYRHISGWQFAIWMFTGNESDVWRNLNTLSGIIIRQFPAVVLPVVIFGIYHLTRKAGSVLAMLLLVTFANILLGINYSIPDIDSYFLPTISIIGLLAMFGFLFLCDFLKNRFVLPTIGVILLVWQVISIADTNWKGDYTLPEDFARNIGRSAEYKAVILSELWDHHGQAAYLQQAEYFRPDIKFIDKELLRRSWYFKTIRNLYPEIYDGIADIVPHFLAELKHFENDDEYDSEVLEYYFHTIINRLLLVCGPSYIDYVLNYKPQGDHFLRPQGVLLKLDTIPASNILPRPELIWRGKSHDEYSDWRAVHHVEMIYDYTLGRR